MFSRIQEAFQLLTYREPENGPDAVIVERDTLSASRAGKIISHVLEFAMVVCGLAYASGRIGERLSKMIPPARSLSVAIIAGAVGVVLTFIVHSVRDDIEKKIRARINLAEVLAPYFGHRLDNTMRTLKG